MTYPEDDLKHACEGEVRDITGALVPLISDGEVYSFGSDKKFRLTDSEYEACPKIVVDPDSTTRVVYSLSFDSRGGEDLTKLSMLQLLDRQCSRRSPDCVMVIVQRDADPSTHVVQKQNAEMVKELNVFKGISHPRIVIRNDSYDPEVFDEIARRLVLDGMLGDSEWIFASYENETLRMLSERVRREYGIQVGYENLIRSLHQFIRKKSEENLRGGTASYYKIASNWVAQAATCELLEPDGIKIFPPAFNIIEDKFRFELLALPYVVRAQNLMYLDVFSANPALRQGVVSDNLVKVYLNFADFMHRRFTLQARHLECDVANELKNRLEYEMRVLECLTRVGMAMFPKRKEYNPQATSATVSMTKLLRHVRQSCGPLPKYTPKCYTTDNKEEVSE